MPKIYNHSHFPVASYAAHNPEKYNDMVQNGALHSIKALPCTEPNDIVQLDPRLKGSLSYMSDHYAEVGLDITGEVVWDTSMDVVSRFPEHELSPYSFGRARHNVRPNQKRYEATKLCNNKNRFLEFCEERGYPVPHTVMVDEASALQGNNFDFPVFVKAARASSGLDIYKASNIDELMDGISKVGSRYQVQQEVADVLSFLNVQYRTVGNAMIHLATTEQILDGFSHRGNRYPARYNPRHITDRLAYDVAELGLEDIFAFDVAVTPNDMKIIECNARWNGSSYPTVVAERLGVGEWKSIILSSNIEHIEEINLTDLSYDRDRGYGIIITNPASLETERKIGAMIAGPADVQNELEEELQESLNRKYVPQMPIVAEIDEPLADKPLAA